MEEKESKPLVCLKKKLKRQKKKKEEEESDCAVKKGIKAIYQASQMGKAEDFSLPQETDILIRRERKLGRCSSATYYYIYIAN